VGIYENWIVQLQAGCGVQDFRGQQLRLREQGMRAGREIGEPRSDSARTEFRFPNGEANAWSELVLGHQL